MKTVDIVIISAANSRDLLRETRMCLHSLFASETDISFQVVVIESAKNVTYNMPNVTTIHPDVPFGYHRYLNIGRKMGNAPYVCLCNNDLEFTPGWATTLIDKMEADPELLSTSPFCYGSHPHNDIPFDSGDYEGYAVRKRIAGWCIFQKR